MLRPEDVIDMTDLRQVLRDARARGATAAVVHPSIAERVAEFIGEENAREEVKHLRAVIGMLMEIIGMDTLDIPANLLNEYSDRVPEFRLDWPHGMVQIRLAKQEKAA